MASFGLEGPGLNSGQRGKRQTGPSGLGAPAAKRARRPERAGAFADGDAAPGAPPPRPRLKETRVGRPAAAERRDFGLNLPSSASREAYRNAVGAFPGMAAHRRDQGFELVGVQTAEERSEANRQRAEQEGDVLEVDDDSSAVAAPPSQPGLNAVQQARNRPGARASIIPKMCRRTCGGRARPTTPPTTISS